MRARHADATADRTPGAANPAPDIPNPAHRAAEDAHIVEIAVRPLRKIHRRIGRPEIERLHQLVIRRDDQTPEEALNVVPKEIGTAIVRRIVPPRDKTPARNRPADRATPARAITPPTTALSNHVRIAFLLRAGFGVTAARLLLAFRRTRFRRRFPQFHNARNAFRANA